MSRADQAQDAAGAVPKALRVLEAIAERKRPLSITEIAAGLNLPPPTAHRIVRGLVRLGFLAREPGGRRIVEGTRFINLAFSVLQAAASAGSRHAILAALARKTGESCNLGVMAQGNVLYIDRVETQWPLGLRFEPGSRVPLHCTAIGKLLLSEIAADALDEHLSNGLLTRYTATTITDRRRLKEELRRIRKQGYSIDNQEFMSGVVCIAVAVRATDSAPACAGVAISAAEARLTLPKIKRFLPDLKLAAAKLGRSLTGSRREPGRRIAGVRTEGSQ